jgi:hypothetical protein
MFELYWKLDRESKQTAMREPENPTHTRMTTSHIIHQETTA